MQDKEIIEYVMKRLLEKRADDVVLSIERQENSLIKFSNSKISTTKTWDLMTLNVFVSMNKKLVLTSIKDFSTKAADDAINKLMKFIKNAVPNSEYNAIAKGPFKYKDVKDGYDKKIVDLEDKNEDIVEDAINHAINNKAERVAGTFETSIYNKTLLTSNNVNAEDKATSAYLSLRVLNNDSSGHMVGVSRTLNKLDIKKIAETAADYANQGKNPQNISAGKYDVLFSPLAFSNIMDNLGQAFSIFSVESGLSCLANKLNKKIASNIVNFYDDATLENGSNSCKFDDEGVPTQKNKLIKKGILNTYLHNTSTAIRYNTKTTANAGIISPQPYNLIIEKGDFTKDELIRNIKKGIYITNLWYTRFHNYNTGEFSTIPRDAAFYVENGKIIKPVTDIRLSDNLINVFKNIVKIGNDPIQCRGWEVETPCLTPHVLVKNLNITKPIDD